MDSIDMSANAIMLPNFFPAVSITHLSRVSFGNDFFAFPNHPILYLNIHFQSLFMINADVIDKSLLSDK